jgi:hypothetical protein
VLLKKGPKYLSCYSFLQSSLYILKIYCQGKCALREKKLLDLWRTNGYYFILDVLGFFFFFF